MTAMWQHNKEFECAFTREWGYCRPGRRYKLLEDVMDLDNVQYTRHSYQEGGLQSLQISMKLIQ